MLGDVAVQDAPPIMSDHEKAVQHAKPDGRNREEVHCGNHFLMVPQKDQPTFTRLGVLRRSFHPAGDRPFRDVETEHQQFPMDAWRSPSRVLRHHAEDQLPHLLRCRPSPNRSPDSEDQPPIHPKASPVPANNSFWSDDNERLLPLQPHPTDGNPEELVKQIESWPRTTPFQHGQLLSQQEVFKDEIPAVTKDSKERPEREPEHAEHSPIYNNSAGIGSAAKLLIPALARVLARHNGQLLSQREVFKDEIPAVTEGAKDRPEREPEHAEHTRSYNRILAAGRRLCH